LVSGVMLQTATITVLVILWPAKHMLLYGKNISSKRAKPQFVDFVVFFNVQENARIGNHRIHGKQLKHTMIYILQTRSANTISLLITFIVWRHYVHHVEL